eukprot:4264860-Alexandrium_andersonii.AAC.1
MLERSLPSVRARAGHAIRCAPSQLLRRALRALLDLREQDLRRHLRDLRVGACAELELAEDD